MEEKDDIITIDFKALLSVLWSNKWLVLAITSIFIVGGAWYAFTTREEFVAEGKILPEMSSGASSSLGGLANLVGIGGFELGMKNNTEAIRPDLYPDILQSTPFYLELFKESFCTKNGDTLCFDDFYNLEIQGGISTREQLTHLDLKPNDVIVLNRVTSERIADLKDRVNGAIDKKSGVISISVKMPDPFVAAGIASFSMKYLTNYVSDYRTQKNKRNVDFLGRKVAAAKGVFYRDQSKKASYADRFSASTIRLKSADVQRERLESDYKLSSTVYNELLKKYEESKITLQQETPVFQVLEPPVVPTLKSEPKKSIIVFVAAFLGLLTAVTFTLLYKKNYKKIIF